MQIDGVLNNQLKSNFDASDYQQNSSISPSGNKCDGLSIYKYDNDEQQSLLRAKPWERDVHFFKNIKVSALALLKMVMHAKSGGPKEIMGLLLGKVDANVMVVMDSFALPVEGTETRVNAQAQGYEYMTEYVEAAKKVGRFENAIGWYHSHPGYGCWLSGIDVSTQLLNQSYQDPFVAIVIDPIRTASSGKVDIGAFRTYPKGYKSLAENSDGGQSTSSTVSSVNSTTLNVSNSNTAFSDPEYQSIPFDKIADFGVHCNSYYSLEMEYFKSPLDSSLLNNLWSHYWTSTLSDESSSSISNIEYVNGQIKDLSTKMNALDASSIGNHTVITTATHMIPYVPPTASDYCPEKQEVARSASSRKSTPSEMGQQSSSPGLVNGGLERQGNKKSSSGKMTASITTDKVSKLGQDALKMSEESLDTLLSQTMKQKVFVGGTDTSVVNSNFGGETNTEFMKEIIKIQKYISAL